VGCRRRRGRRSRDGRWLGRRRRRRVRSHHKREDRYEVQHVNSFDHLSLCP
jgi:hypothetical protein